ncbi:hypothetical protein SETIT_5G199200v2 [Setaria italica]|uniref:Pentatricopeptide repeat-containing protein n=1 Tax=Setaria italica TaxID=4555 RepID=K3XQ87_SETIT|nr:hypothetical protein SETIT_5G199200v2 [Setaria italica]
MDDGSGSGQLFSVDPLERQAARGHGVVTSMAAGSDVIILGTSMARSLHGESKRDVPVGNSVLCGELGRARRVSEKMRQRDLGTWNSMIFGCCRSDEWEEEARRLLDDMRSEGTEPGVVTWNTLISSYARSRDLDVAMELLEQMEESGVALDVVTWTSLVSGFVHSDKGMRHFSVSSVCVLLESNQMV